MIQGTNNMNIFWQSQIPKAIIIIQNEILILKTWYMLISNYS